MKKIAIAFLIFYGVAAAGMPKKDAQGTYKITVSSDKNGLCTIDVTQDVVLKTDWAIDHFGDPKVHYDANRQSIKIKAYSVNPAGKKIISVKRAINASTPPQLSKTPELARQQEYVVSFLGLERGSLTHLHYTIKDKKPAYYGEVFRYPLTHGVVIKDLTLILKPADAFDWVIKDVPAGFKPKVTENNGILTVKFGPYGQIESVYHPVLVVYKKNFNINRDKSLQKCQDFVKRLMPKNKKDPVVYANAIVRGLLKRLRVVELPLGLFSMKTRPLCRVLKSGYASKLEAANLLQALFNKAGFKSRIITMEGPFNYGRLSTIAMDDIGVSVDIPGQEKVMFKLPSGSPEVERIALEGKRYAVLNRPGLTLKGPAAGGPQDKAINLVVNMKIDKKGKIKGTAVFTYKMNIGAYLRPVKKIKGLLMQTLKHWGFKGLKVDSVKIVKKSLKKVIVKAKLSGKVQDGALVNGIPEWTKRYYRSSKYIPGCMDVKWKFNIKLAKPWKFASVPGSMKGSIGNAGYTMKAKVKTHRLNLNGHAWMNDRYVRPEDLDKIQDLFRPIAGPASWIVTLFK